MAFIIYDIYAYTGVLLNFHFCLDKITNITYILPERLKPPRNQRCFFFKHLDHLDLPFGE